VGDDRAKAGQVRLGAGVGTGEILVQHAPVLPGQGAADELLAMVAGRAVVDGHVVGVGDEARPGEAVVDRQGLVGVDGEGVCAEASGGVEHLVAVVGEVDPGSLEEHPREVAERLADQLLGAVGRAGVGDHP
jgi:hypothetical protein